MTNRGYKARRDRARKLSRCVVQPLLTRLEGEAVYMALQYYDECAEVGGDRTTDTFLEAALTRAIVKVRKELNNERGWPR